MHYQEHQNIYKSGLKFDGIVTSEDFLAVGAMNFAKANKIDVPSELQIVGYNNSILAHCSEPNISSIDNRLFSHPSPTTRTPPAFGCFIRSARIFLVYS